MTPPFPWQQPIPTGWSQHHRPTAAATMTATGMLLRKDADPNNDDDGWTADGGQAPAASDVPVWTGPCRVQALTTHPQSADAAGEAINTHHYRVSIATDAPTVRAGTDQGDTFIVTACPDDPHLVGRVLRVVDVMHGSLMWQRDLMCMDDIALNNPPLGAA